MTRSMKENVSFCNGLVCLLIFMVFFPLNYLRAVADIFKALADKDFVGFKWKLTQFGRWSSGNQDDESVTALITKVSDSLAAAISSITMT